MLKIKKTEEELKTFLSSDTTARKSFWAALKRSKNKPELKIRVEIEISKRIS